MNRPASDSTAAPAGSGVRPPLGGVSNLQQLQFQQLLVEVSARFINVPTEQIDQSIRQALGEVAGFLGFNVGALSKFTGQGKVGEVTHIWTAEGLPPIPPGFTELDFPWIAERLTQGHPVHLTRLDDLPPAGRRDRQTYEKLGMQSAYNWPLQVGEAIVGCLALASVGETRPFPVQFEPGLKLLAQVMASTLARARVDRALRDSEARLNLAADAAAVGLWSLNLATNCFWLTPRTRELFGFEADETVTFDHFLTMVHPDDQELVRQTAQTLTRSAVEGKVEYRVIRREGSQRWMLSRGRAQFDKFGVPNYLMGVSVDITEQRQAEEKVRQLSVAVEHGPVLMVITDPQGKIVFVNRKFTEVTGFSSEECLGQNPRMWKSGECPPGFYQELWRCLTSGKTWRGEFHNRRKNGELYWESAVISPLLDAAGRITHFVAIKEDITERKRAEAEIARQRNELAHISRVSTLSELSGSLAHELNQPLGIILSNAQAAQELLLRNPPEVAEVGEILADIVAADRRAAQIIQRLRALMKRGETSLRLLQLNDLLEEVLSLVRSDLIGRGVAVACHLAADLPRVNADRVQLQQLLLNLILNAADAMADNPAGRRQLQLTTARQQHFVRVSVRDDGVGLPADVEGLFQPFYTTKAHGLGMGLAICRSIISAHHGRLWAESLPHRGAVFHFELPMADSLSHP